MLLQLVALLLKKKVTLGCNGDITKEYESIDSDIEINAIRLMQNNTNVLIISVDTLFVTNEIKTFAIDYLQDQLPLKEEQVFIAASHTHYAPFLDASKPNLGTVDDAYYDYFIHKLKTLLDKLVSSTPEEAELQYTTANIDDVSIGRRKRVWHPWRWFLIRKEMRIFPNSDQKIDTKLHCLQWVSKNSRKPLGVMWNFACHPVSFYNPNNLSAHYIDDIRQHIRQKANIPVVFLQGFSGDIRPKVIGDDPFQNMLNKASNSFIKWNEFANYLRSVRRTFITFLNKGKGFCTFTETSYFEWVEKIRNKVDFCLKNHHRIMTHSSIKPILNTMPLSKISCTKSEQMVEFHGIHLNNEIIILGVSAEVVSEYSLKLQAMHPDKIIIPVGCVSTVFGYWPTKNMLKEGGYEVIRFQENFSLDGDFKESLEDTFYKVANDIIQNK